MNNFDNTLMNLKLQSDLKNFGLNPREWNLERIQTSLKFLIKNRIHEDFAMFGELEFKKEKPQWKSLEIVSL